MSITINDQEKPYGNNIKCMYQGKIGPRNQQKHAAITNTNSGQILKKIKKKYGLTFSIIDIDSWQNNSLSYILLILKGDMLRIVHACTLRQG